jgi:hypothetical protein
MEVLPVSHAIILVVNVMETKMINVHPAIYQLTEIYQGLSVAVLTAISIKVV